MTRQHTVEKIGGTSMSRSDELLDTLLIGDRKGADLYQRIFVVSAYGGITDMLLENKKTGAPGVYAWYNAEHSGRDWSDALDRVCERMIELNAALLSDSADRRAADDFVRERIEGARNCLIDLQRICSYGHFQLSEHMLTIREMLSGLGEAHSAHTTTLMLRRHGVNACFVDLSGWRSETQPDLDGRIDAAFADIDLSRELPIVTGYAHCREGLMRLYDRGYSEVTFSRIAARTGAREAIIHKEFHLSSADPKIVGADKVRKIGHTNYDVADQLSNLGMEAIHPSAAKTLRQADIGLRVANAFEPHDPGTIIEPEIGGEPQVQMITGLDVFALEVFEQDMVGVKGYDTTVLEALKRHAVRIVAKSSNANTITHYVDASLKSVRRVEAEIARSFPSARIHVQRVSLVCVVGRSLEGLSVMLRGLTALEAAGIAPIASHQNGRRVDVQFVVGEEQKLDAVRALHRALVEQQGAAAKSVPAVAAA
jgi:aspartate kinase